MMMVGIMLMDIEMIIKPCNYQKCLTCPQSTCYTGQIAREKGEDMYEQFIQELDECIEAGCNCVQASHSRPSEKC